MTFFVLYSNMRNHAVCLCIWLTYEMHNFMQQSCNVQLYIKRSLQDLVIDGQKSTVRDFFALLKIIYNVCIALNCNIDLSVSFPRLNMYCGLILISIF